MAKPSHASARSAAGKKKKRPDLKPEPRATTQAAPVAVRAEPAEAERVGNGHTSEAVLQFRPRSAREAAPVRTAPGRASTPRSALPTMDYSYVYTDLRIIAVLVSSLLVALIVLSFIIR